MDPSHHQQDMMGSSDDQSLESIVMCPAKSSQSDSVAKKPKPQHEQALKCPRCDSTNTKFCYYNNYSLTQPRYFCKGCRRYWTKGGTLRNVPVGGGCRKSRRPSSSSASKHALIITSAAHHEDLMGLNSTDNVPLINSLHGLLGYNQAPNNPIPFAHHGQLFDGHDLPIHQLGFLDSPGSMNINLHGLYYGPGEGTVGDHQVSIIGDQSTWPMINGDGFGNYSGEFDPIKGGNWNGVGFGSSSWHGLLNSTPLM